MRLLVTRPMPDAARTAAKLVAAGHTVIVHPLLTVNFNPPPDGLPFPGAIVVTSQNAVRALAGWGETKDWRGAPAFASGAATAEALEGLGFTNIRGVAKDAASLAQLIVAGLPADVGPLIYPTARDRAGALAGGLMARGYDVRAIEAYRADAVDGLDGDVRQALVAGSVDGILLYSARTARIFLDLAKHEAIGITLSKPTYFVLSHHIAGLLSHLGAAICVPARPDEESLLALIPGGR